MNKYKVGDKVRVINGNGSWHDYLIGATGVIDEVTIGELYRVKFDVDFVWWIEDELELVESELDKWNKKSEADKIMSHLIKKEEKIHMEKETTVDKIIGDIRQNNPSCNGNVKFGDVNATNRKTMCHIGDIMVRGNQINRLCELQDLANLNLNIDCYSAMLNEKINDKSGVTEEENNKLAEHIYKADIDRLFDANIIVGEVLASSIGSMCEMAMLDGFKLVSEKMSKILNNKDMNNFEMLAELEKLKNKLNKDIYYHSFDLRNTNLKESGWRRSHSINQLQYAFMMHSAVDLYYGKRY